MAYITNFEKHEDGRLYGKERRTDEFGEPDDVTVLVTKKALKEELLSIFYIKQFEEYVGVEVEKFDDFVQALFALRIVELSSRFLDERIAASLPDTDKEQNSAIASEIQNKIQDEVDVVCGQILFGINRKEISKADLYDRWGRKLLTEMWSNGDSELGLNFGDMWGEYDLEAEDFIGESPLYKKAVVKYCMINVADSVANVLTGWNQGPHNYMEDLLDLPEE